MARRSILSQLFRQSAGSVSIFESDFFLTGFPNPLIVYSRPSFLFRPHFHFSLVVFVLTCGILKLIFCFFLNLI